MSITGFIEAGNIYIVATDLTITRNCVLGILLSGQAHAGAASGGTQGPNATLCAGAGHGGSGGGADLRSGVFAYDSVLAPAQAGSYGCARTGVNYGESGLAGGVAYLIADTCVVDGLVEAKGYSGGSAGTGGGSGGSIYISARIFEGSGNITVEGGPGTQETAQNYFGCGGGIQC